MEGSEESPYGLLPLKIGPLVVRQLAWGDFIELDYNQGSAFYAHIFWSIGYTTQEVGGALRVKTLWVKVSEKSWVVKSLKQPALLAHEAGHYIIGCLCALQFLKCVNIEQRLTKNDDVQALLNSCLKKWGKVQKDYDDETNHYLNSHKQKEWEERLACQLYAYLDIFPCGQPEFAVA